MTNDNILPAEETSSRGSTPASSVPPANPIMSTYQESYEGAGDWYAISGGKPKFDWSGLEDSVSSRHVNPKQHRPAKQKSKLEAYKYRVQGLKVAFKEGMNIKQSQG